MEVPRATFLVEGSLAFVLMQDTDDEHETMPGQYDPSVFEPTWTIAVGEAPSDMICSLSGERVLRGQHIYSVVHHTSSDVFCSDDSLSLSSRGLVAAVTWPFLYRWRRMVKAALANDPDKRGYNGVCPLTFGTGEIARARGGRVSDADLDVEWRTARRPRMDWLLNAMHHSWRSTAPLQTGKMINFLRNPTGPLPPHVVLNNILTEERATRLAQQFWTDVLVHRQRDGRQAPRDLTDVDSEIALQSVDMTRSTGILSDPRYYWTQTCQDLSTDQNVLDAIRQATETHGVLKPDTDVAAQREMLVPVSPVMRCFGVRYDRLLMRIVTARKGYVRSYYGIVVLNQAPGTAVLGRVVRVESASGLEISAVPNVKMAKHLMQQPRLLVQREHPLSTPTRRVFETVNLMRIHVEPLATEHNSMVIASTDDFIVVFDDFQSAMDAPPAMLFWVALGAHNEQQTSRPEEIERNRLSWPDPENVSERPDVLRHSQYTSMADMLHQMNMNYADVVYNTEACERTVAFLTARAGPPRTRERDPEDAAAAESAFILPTEKDPRNVGPAGSVPYFPPHLSPQGETYHLLRPRPSTWSSNKWLEENRAPGNQMELFGSAEHGYEEGGTHNDDGDSQLTQPMELPLPEPDVVWEREFPL